MGPIEALKTLEELVDALAFESIVVHSKLDVKSDFKLLLVEMAALVVLG